MTGSISTQDTLNSFVGYLIALQDNDVRGVLASLRRGLGQQPGSVPETARIVERQLRVDTHDSIRNACYIIGSLFALHNVHADSGNIGRHFRAMGKQGEDPPANVERRFLALLASDKDELPDALRQAVTLLKSKSVPVNWFQLAHDVQRWQFDEGRDQVRKNWSRSFWNAERPRLDVIQTGANNS